MIGNSLIPVLVSDNDQGFEVTYNSQTTSPGYTGYKAFDGNKSTYWYSGNAYVPVWLQIEFPKSIKLTGIVVKTPVFAAYKRWCSKDKISYSEFKGDQIITKVVKITGNSTPNDTSLSTIYDIQVYGFYSPGNFLIKTPNNYIYNGNTEDKNSNTIENININNILPEFVEEYDNILSNIDEAFTIIKIVK